MKAAADVRPTGLTGILDVMGTVAIFGDVGGHSAELRAGLTRLGANVDKGILPDGLSVVQVGDLVHRGPASGQVLEIVARFVRRYPTRWCQLTGNHESLYLPGAPCFDWPEVLPHLTEHLIRKWWRQDVMRVAAAVCAPGGDLLVTHAGLTLGLWERLDRPTGAAQAADLLNHLKDGQAGWLWESGLMLGQRSSPNSAAGPIWAEATHEVYLPWMWHHGNGGVVPFGQVHGHSSAHAFGYGWRGNGTVQAALNRAGFEASYEKRQVTGLIGGRSFTGVDPGFGAKAGFGWEPLVLDGARLL